MGIPSPGETALVLAAVLASQGKLSIWLVIPIAIVSAIVGDNIGYWLGRKVGRDVLEAPGPFHRAPGRRDRRGRPLLRRARPEGGVHRPLDRARPVRGRLARRHRRDAVPDCSSSTTPPGAITWALAFGLLGYFGGEAAAHVLEQFGIGAAIALGVLGVGAVDLLQGAGAPRRRASCRRRRAGDCRAGPPRIPCPGQPSWSNSSAQELMQ